MTQLFISTVTKEYPVTLEDIRKRNPNVSFPQIVTRKDVEEFGYSPVRPSPKPAHDIVYFDARDGVPEYDEEAGDWVQTWELVQVDNDEAATRLERIRERLLVANNQRFEAASVALLEGYPPSEVNTWNIQRQEALAWEVDNTVSTPWLDSVASARGIGREDLLSRTLQKVKLFSIASAALVGRRQSIEDRLLSAKKPEDLHAVSITYE